MDQTTLVLIGAANVGRFIDGARPVASSHAEHLATANNTVSWALSGDADTRRPPAIPKEKEIRAIKDKDRQETARPTGPTSTNKKGEQLCIPHQTGHCYKPKKGNPAICPKHPDRRHQCENCLALHSAADGTQKPAGKGKGADKKKKYRRGKNS